MPRSLSSLMKHLARRGGEPRPVSTRQSRPMGEVRTAGRAALVVLGIIGLGLLLFVAWPLPSGLMDREGALSVRVLDREGTLLRELPSRRESRSVSLPRGA